MMSENRGVPEEHSAAEDRSDKGRSEPVLDAIAKAATTVTSAAAGWVVAVDGDRLVVRAVAGDAPASLVGRSVTPGDGPTGYVVAAAQPLALASRADDPRAADGLMAALGHPPGSVLCVPCEIDDRVVGAMELVDKADDGRFSYDDVELASVLAGIAAVALVAGSEGEGDSPGLRPPPPPSPSELAAGLARLAAEAPARYPAIAEVVATLVDG